jgi:hypothetical protein
MIGQIDYAKVVNLKEEGLVMRLVTVDVRNKRKREWIFRTENIETTHSWFIHIQETLSMASIMLFPCRSHIFSLLRTLYRTRYNFCCDIK